MIKRLSVLPLLLLAIPAGAVEKGAVKIKGCPSNPTGSIEAVHLHSYNEEDHLRTFAFEKVKISPGQTTQIHCKKKRGPKTDNTSCRVGFSWHKNEGSLVKFNQWLRVDWPGGHEGTPSATVTGSYDEPDC